MAHARGLIQQRDHTFAERLLCAVSRKLEHGEEGNLGSLVASPITHLSRVLVQRLAELIKAAGLCRTVVLSSSWRKPKCEVRKAELEIEISCYLGEPFHFDAQTPDLREFMPVDRMNCIGDYIAGLAPPPKGRLRLLVLDDFFAIPLGSQVCENFNVRSRKRVEQFFMHRCRDPALTEVRLVHTYDEWTTRGLKVQVGTGLTIEHFSDAMNFLECDIESRTLQNSKLQNEFPPNEAAAGQLKLPRIWGSRTAASLKQFVNM